MKHLLGNIAKTILAVAALCSPAAAKAENNYSSNCCPPACDRAPVCGVAYNPPAYPCGGCNPCSGGWVVSADFLWWKASVGGIALGSEELATLAEDDSNPALNVQRLGDSSSVKKPKFDFDPGFRIGIANTCVCDCWDVALSWTHFRTKASTSGISLLDDSGSENTTNIVFVPYWERFGNNPLGGFSLPAASTGHYTLQIDLLDLEFGRKYYVSSCFAVRPFIGLRGARVDQNYKVYSESADSVFGPAFTSFAKSKNDYIAIGPRAGLDVDVHLGCGFAVVGKAAGSIVYGRFDRHSCEVYDTVKGVTAPDAANLRYNTKGAKVNASRAITDLALGLKWEKCFDWCNGSYPLALAVMWEQHGFFNMSSFDFAASAIQVESAKGSIPSFIGIQPPSKVGDIFTQGLTVSASVGF